MSRDNPFDNDPTSGSADGVFGDSGIPDEIRRSEDREDDASIEDIIRNRETDHQSDPSLDSGSGGIIGSSPQGPVMGSSPTQGTSSGAGDPVKRSTPRGKAVVPGQEEDVYPAGSTGGGDGEPQSNFSDDGSELEEMFGPAEEDSSDSDGKTNPLGSKKSPSDRIADPSNKGSGKDPKGKGDKGGKTPQKDDEGPSEDAGGPAPGGTNPFGESTANSPFSNGDGKKSNPFADDVLPGKPPTNRANPNSANGKSNKKPSNKKKIAGNIGKAAALGAATAATGGVAGVAAAGAGAAGAAGAGAAGAAGAGAAGAAGAGAAGAGAAGAGAAGAGGSGLGAAAAKAGAKAGAKEAGKSLLPGQGGPDDGARRAPRSRGKIASEQAARDDERERDERESQSQENEEKSNSLVKKGKNPLMILLSIISMTFMLTNILSSGNEALEQSKALFDTETCLPGANSGNLEDAASGGIRGVANGEWSKPEIIPPGKFTSGFGPRWGDQHMGLDISTNFGTPIYAMYDGTVISAGPALGYGSWIRIHHVWEGEDITTVYGHMKQSSHKVKVGDKVGAGQHIADEASEGQSTGSHVHVQVEKGAAGGTPEDPKPWVDSASNPTPADGSAPPPEAEQVSNEPSESESPDPSESESEEPDSEGADSSDSESTEIEGSQVNIVGDSLTEGAKSQIEELLPGVKIDSKVGRQFSEGMTIAADLPDEDRKVLAMPLGTNGPFSIEDIDKVVESAGDSKVVLMTVGGEKVTSAEAVNKVVQEAKEKHGDKIIIADWAAKVEADPGLIGSDGVHPTPEGQKEFASTLVNAIKSGSSGGATSEDEGLSGYSCCVAMENDDHSSSGGVVPDSAKDLNEVVERNAKIVIGAGKYLDQDEDAIIMTLMVALVESELQNYANDASGEGSLVPASELRKSLEYDYDAVGQDHDSVGILQQRVDMWGDVEDLMKPAFQAGQFFAHADGGQFEGGSLGETAANIQNPREDLRGKYALREDEAREIYKQFKDAELSEEDKKAAQKGWDRISAGSGGGDEDSSGSSSSSKNATAVSCGSKSTSGSSEYASDIGKKVVEEAKKQLGKPYVWGATGPESFDCSGLMLWAYQKAGVTIPRVTGDQVNGGEKIDKSDIQPGDLMLNSPPSHVVMYIGDGEVIHAPQPGDVVQTMPVDFDEYPQIRRYAK